MQTYNDLLFQSCNTTSTIDLENVTKETTISGSQSTVKSLIVCASNV